MIDAVYDLFDLFNGHYYAGELEKPVILIQTNGREHRSMGWCTVKRVWKNEAEGTTHYEITLSAEFMYRDIEEICSTLLHEMVHLHCRYEDIKETSRGVMYHNNKFKQIAEAHGLIIDYDKRIGYSISRINDETNEIIKAYRKVNPFIFTRKVHKGEVEAESTTAEPTEVVEKPKKPIHTYRCPMCEDVSFRSSKDLRVKCGECDSLLEY